MVVLGNTCAKNSKMVSHKSSHFVSRKGSHCTIEWWNSQDNSSINWFWLVEINKLADHTKTRVKPTGWAWGERGGHRDRSLWWRRFSCVSNREHGALEALLSLLKSITHESMGTLFSEAQWQWDSHLTLAHDPPKWACLTGITARARLPTAWRN